MSMKMKAAVFIEAGRIVLEEKPYTGRRTARCADPHHNDHHLWD